MDVTWSDDGALDTESVGDERHVGNAEVALGDTEREDDGGWAEDRDNEVPVCCFCD